MRFPIFFSLFLAFISVINTVHASPLPAYRCDVERHPYLFFDDHEFWGQNLYRVYSGYAFSPYPISKEDPTRVDEEIWLQKIDKTEKGEAQYSNGRIKFIVTSERAYLMLSDGIEYLCHPTGD
ncbi:hypothetical protein J4N42_08385 [Vibrio sp. SCSIO 43135]|uniref:hypothetical protein n=1 Tax=Vibrio sp. SCSIO 43135 TaxID=2819096 RepID=UPI002074F6BC|nr:hypothetical protein [Vibrio sp. SCSIO 43135]USD40094.1 hypothetical protein J4N42_08385 [Vibrio sp. SCSIO 43135]